MIGENEETLNCFESAQTKIFSLMFSDSFPRFMASLDEVITPPTTRKVQKSKTCLSTQFNVSRTSLDKITGVLNQEAEVFDDNFSKIREFFYQKQLHDSLGDLAKERHSLPCIFGHNIPTTQSCNSAISIYSLDNAQPMSPVTDKKIAKVIKKYKVRI